MPDARLRLPILNRLPAGWALSSLSLITANLAAKMKEVNDEKKLAKTSPSEAAIEKFITVAKTMEPKLTY